MNIEEQLFSLLNSISSGSKNIEPSLLKFELLYEEFKQELKIKTKIDAAINSKSIINDINNGMSKKAFHPVDYSGVVLHSLALSYPSKDSVITFIDKIVDAYKESLGVQDIIITSSGATRCKTNIRFSINKLRDIGLLLDQDPEGKRTWSPSVYGLLVLIYIQIAPKSCGIPHNKEKSGINEIGFIDFNKIHSILVGNQINPENLIQNIYSVYDISTRTDEIKLLTNLLVEYIDFTSGCFIVTNEGLKETPDFKQKASMFRNNLTIMQRQHTELHNMLLLKYKSLHRNIN